MSIKQDKSGNWLLHINKNGIPRLRKKFATKSEAITYEHNYIIQHQPGKYAASNDDPRRLGDLIDLWFKYHGVNLSDGDRRRRCLVVMANRLGNPVAASFSVESFVSYRFDRIQEGLSLKTFNNQHSYLSAMFETLIKLDVIKYQNPLDKVDYLKVQERQLSYLSGNQIQLLLDTISDGCLNESTFWVTQLCLRTGARWGEAEKLRFKQLHNGRVTYEFTKSKRTRTVPLDVSFYDELLYFAGCKNPDDRVFTNCIGSFRRAVVRADITLPTGQNSHILRHTFASHFVMNGGNILSLQKILGHADIAMTMRYAHLAPDHLNDAIKFNPVVMSGC